LIPVKQKPTKFSILQWLKEHSTQFSIMTIIVKQILVMPVSTVVLEQAFSVGRNILDQIHSSMSSGQWRPKHVLMIDKSSVEAIRNRAKRK